MGKKFMDSAADEAGSQTVDFISGNAQPIIDAAQAQIDDAKTQALAAIDDAKAQAQAAKEQAKAEIDEKKQQAQDELDAEKAKLQAELDDARDVSSPSIVC